MNLKKTYSHYLRIVKDDDIGIFDEWVKLFINQHLNFAYMLFGNNLENDEQVRSSAYRTSIKYGKVSLEDIKLLGEMNVSRENHDDRGLLSLIKAYCTRNMYICKKYIGEPDAVNWLKETVEERESLKK